MNNLSQLTIYIVIITLLHINLSSTTKPGVQIRLTKKGFDYANSVAQATLAQQLKSLSLPDQRGKSGHTEWSLTKIRNTGVTVPTSKMVVSTKGLTWSLTGLSINLHADWRVKYKRGWFHISTSGSVDAGFSDARASATVLISKDKNGRPLIRANGCSGNIAKVHLKFHHGITSKILNILKSTLEHKIRDMIKPKICDVINKVINTDAEKSLLKTKISALIQKKYRLDYSLIANPIWNAQFVETQHKGEVFWFTSNKEAPMTPPNIPTQTDNSRMLYLWLTDYTANTLLFTAQRHKQLDHVFSSNLLSKTYKDFLNTDSKTFSIGTLFPEVKKKYPHSTVELRIDAPTVPKVSFQTNSINGKVEETVGVYVHSAGGKSLKVISLKLHLDFKLGASISHERLVGKVLGHNFKITVDKTSVIHPSEKTLNDIAKAAIDILLIPNLNTKLGAGVDLPISTDLKFENVQLKSLNGALMVATDVKYQPK